jgi:hypothetical protein
MARAERHTGQNIVFPAQVYASGRFATLELGANLVYLLLELGEREMRRSIRARL